MFWDILQGVCLLVLAVVFLSFVRNLKRQRELEAQGVIFSGTFAYFTDVMKMVYYSIYSPYQVSFCKVVQDVGDGKIHRQFQVLISVVFKLYFLTVQSTLTKYS